MRINKILGKIKNLKFFRWIYFIAIYWPLFWLSGFVPRNRKLWLISSYNGFADNSKYFYIFNCDYLKSKYDIDLVWLAHAEQHADTLKAAGFTSLALKRSAFGLLCSIRAGVNISSGGFDDFYSNLSRSVYHVNLWHGVGLKNMLFKSQLEKEQFGKKSLISKILHPLIYRKYDYFLSTSRLMSEHFAECFDLPADRFHFGMYPRCAPLVMPHSELLNFIEKYEQENTKTIIEKLKKYRKIFIYMPTWRDSNPGFLLSDKFHWEAVNAALKSRDYLLLLKPHPAADVAGLKSFTNIEILNSRQDVYPILPFTDCLITDYSSIYFDYLLMSNNITLFIFDYDEYITASRDLAYPFKDNMVGHTIENQNGLVEFFKIYDEIDFSIYAKRMEVIENKFLGAVSLEANLCDGIVTEAMK